MREVMRREVRGEQGWRELVARQMQSGLSVREFCRREGLSAWSLYEWRSRLRARREAQAVATELKALSGTPPAQFIDLGALEPTRSRWQIRLDLGGGVVLQLVRG
jgi:hypothetical protein